MNKVWGTLALLCCLSAGNVRGASTQAFDGHRAFHPPRPVADIAASGPPAPVSTLDDGARLGAPIPILDLWSFDIDDVPDSGMPSTAEPQPHSFGESRGSSDNAASPPAPAPDVSGLAIVRARPDAQKLSENSLIHKDLSRRSAVASWGLGAQTELRGFVIQPRTGPGQQKVDEKHNDPYRLQGMLIEQALALDDNDALRLSGGWVSGAVTPGTDTGSGMARAGSAWSFGGKATLLADQLRLSFEYAESQLHIDPGTNQSAPQQPLKDREAGDEAYKAAAEFRSARGSDPVWHLGTEYSWVGPQFRSLANSTLTANRLWLHSYAGIAFDDWHFDVSLGRQRNNLRDDPAITTTHTDKIQLTTTWAPDSANRSGIFGKPRIKVLANLGRNRLALPASLPASGQPIEESVKLRIESEFETARGRWGANATGGQSPGAIDAAEAVGVHTAKLELYGDFTPAPTLPLKPALSWERRRDQATGTIDQRWRAGLRSGVITVRNGVIADLDLRYLQREQSASGDRQVTVGLGGRLVWTLQRPGTGRNGLALTLSGNCRGGHSELLSGEPRDDYQVMLSLSTSNPMAGW